MLLLWWCWARMNKINMLIWHSRNNAKTLTVLPVNRLTYRSKREDGTTLHTSCHTMVNNPPCFSQSWLPLSYIYFFTIFFILFPPKKFKNCCKRHEIPSKVVVHFIFKVPLAAVSPPEAWRLLLNTTMYTSVFYINFFFQTQNYF